MRSFKLSEQYSVVCEWKKTRNGFKHEATLLFNGREAGKAKICYLNRTWEAFEFESVLHECINKHINKDERPALLKVLERGQ
jgi:hypothetical protein